MALQKAGKNGPDKADPPRVEGSKGMRLCVRSTGWGGPGENAGRKKFQKEGNYKGKTVAMLQKDDPLVLKTDESKYS